MDEETPAAAAPAKPAENTKAAPTANVPNKPTSQPVKSSDGPAEAVAGAKSDASSKVDPVPLTGVAAQCADLLDLAKALKTEVDKTTKDVLSIAVVRDSGQIEQMAHKMRESHKH